MRHLGDSLKEAGFFDELPAVKLLHGLDNGNIMPALISPHLKRWRVHV